ncbi:hypothetical protein [Pseudomonas shirazensis]
MLLSSIAFFARILANEKAETFCSPFISALGVGGVSTAGVSAIFGVCGGVTSVETVVFWSSVFGFGISLSVL